MKKEFCTYEQSIALKELGFDEECFSFYGKDGSCAEFAYYDLDRENSTMNSDYMDGEKDCTAPLIQQALRFFREKYKFTHEIKRIDNINDNEHKFIESYYCRVENFDFGFDIGEYNTYEEAEQTCLDKLIELAKDIKS